MTETGLKFYPGFPSLNSLVRDYLSGKEKACAFFGGRHEDSGRIKALADKVDRRLDRSLVAELLRSQSSFRHVSGGDERLCRFERENGFIVTTGQQPVLFGGPLYILYKALTAVKLAERLEGLLGAPVLPVFWNASEDHDFEEISAIGLLDGANNLERVALDPRPWNRSPAFMIQPGPEIERVFSAFGKLIPQTEFSPWLNSILHESYTSGTNLGAAFGELISRLLGGCGLFVVEACSKGLRRAGKELFQRAALESGAENEAFLAACGELSALGYPMQVNPLPGETSLFLIENGSREKLLADSSGEGFSLKPSGVRLSRKELIERLDRSPESFSPGVLLRPLLESHVFGSLCYVAGPGEISYYAQMGGLYELYGLERPIIYPRLSGFLIESKIGKALDKYSLSPADIQSGPQKAADRILSTDTAVQGILERLGKMREDNRQVLSEIRPLIGGLDPTLGGPLDSASESLSSGLERFEKKILSAARRRDEILVNQLEKAYSNLWPGGEPQERVLAGVYFLARYGRDFVSFMEQQAGRIVS